MSVVSAKPAIIDALYDLASAAVTLADVDVTDGYPVDNEIRDQLAIGVDDLFNTSQGAASASSQQEWANIGLDADRQETGEIVCFAIGTDGNGVQKTARDNAYAIAAALGDICRADPSLGIEYVMWTSFGSQFELHQDQDEQGAIAWLVFRIYFIARI